MPDAKARSLLAALSLTGLALAACAGKGEDEMSWARAALERNDRLVIVAADPKLRTFTVRSKDTGELAMVRADQLIAGVAPLASPGAAPSPATPTATVPASAAAAPADTRAGPATTPGANAPGAAAWRGEASEPAPPPPPEPKVFVSRAQQPGGEARPAPGQVLAAGPGYSIEAGSGTAAAPAAAPVLRDPGAVDLRREPIVCQGARLLHIDNLNLQFEGDGVSAENGCEIHITNSRIRATGVGVSARAANVHIDNSLVEGDSGSIDASDGAQIYTVSSRFKGLSRRLDTAAVHDLGGNVWN